MMQNTSRGAGKYGMREIKKEREKQKGEEILLVCHNQERRSL